MKNYKRVTAYECPYCLIMFEDAQSALDCCKKPHQIRAFQCNTCGNLCFYESDVKGCCPQEK